ncbi:MAG: hypothetical protein K8W52_24075 [Deltaproteobacteria bacterium]|nr:hypothetical protein [Deltaproteobacteria bacterium]
MSAVGDWSADAILALLTQAERGWLTAAARAPLAEGDDFLDLDHLERGVRQAPSGDLAFTRVLPRSAVHRNTWAKILYAIAIP